MEPENNTKGNGSLVGLVIIVVILIIGGIYIWISGAEKTKQQEQNQLENVTEEDAAALESLDQDLEGLELDASVNVDTLN